MIMKNSTKITLLGVCLILSLTACSSISHRIADNSLDYQKAKTLAPVLLPADAQTHVFTPLYQVPPHMGENTLNLQNETGKRFQLPKPISTVK